MISIFGIGTAGSNVAKQFSGHKEYNVFEFSEQASDSHYSMHLKRAKSPEACEDFIPDLSLMSGFSEVSGRIQVFLCGSSFSANYTLGLLQQVRDKEIEIFYIKPDIHLLIGEVKLQERAIFRILQEYARSGLLRSLTILSNPELEKIIGQVPIKKFFQTINNTIYYVVHYLNFFEHTEPIIGNLTAPSEVQRVRSIGQIDVGTLEERWYYTLDNDRDTCYYLCISTERLENDGQLHSNIVESLKSKPRNAYKNITYAIYEAPQENDFGFCVSHTNYIQTNKSLDS